MPPIIDLINSIDKNDLLTNKSYGFHGDYIIDNIIFDGNKFKLIDWRQDFGGDIETILLNCKLTHAKRVLGKPYVFHKIINKEDLLNAFEKFKSNKKTKEVNLSHLMMYN